MGRILRSRKPLLPGLALLSQTSAKSAKPAKAGRRPKTTPASATASKKPAGCLGRTLKWGAGLIVVLVACGALANLAPRTATRTTPTTVPVTLAPVTVPATTDTPVSAEAQRVAASVALETATATAVPTEPATATPSPTPTPTLTATPPPTATQLPPTPLPTATAAPTLPPTPAGSVANTSANVREGPGLDAAVVVTAQAGQPLVVTGQDSSGQWLQLASGYWIAASLVDNIPAGLPVTAVAAQLPGGNPTAAPTAAVVEAAAPTATPSWQREERGVIFTSECPCDQGNTLNCDNFGIDMDAQACFMRCMDLTGRDVHGLDRDKDGTACEWKW